MIYIIAHRWLMFSILLIGLQFYVIYELRRCESMKWKTFNHFEWDYGKKSQLSLTMISAVLLISLHIFSALSESITLSNSLQQSTIFYLIVNKALVCFLKKMFFVNNKILGKVVTDSRNMFFKWIKEFHQIFKRSESITIISISNWNVKQSSKSSIKGIWQI